MGTLDPRDIRNVQRYSNEWNVTNRELKSALKLIKDFGKASSKNLKGNIKFLSDFTDELDDGVDKIRGMSKAINKLHLSDALDTKEASNLNSKLGDLQKKLIKIYKTPVEGENQWKAQKIAVKELKKEMDGVEGEIKQASAAGRSFVDVMAESGPGFIKNWAQFKKSADEGETSIQAYAGLFNGVGKKLSELTKMIAGWPALILMGAKALLDMGLAADQFVKDANKAFAYLRGPDIMTKDVEKQFDEFNKQIFDAGKNIRVGLDVGQIRELMEATMQAGKNIQDLNKGLLTYRDAIYVASKASKTMGMVLPQIGSMIGELMTDFRMDLESIDEAFVQVAFDAQKSGLSTDRFWGTVQNASASLALYGVFVKDASKTLKGFTESMVGGAKESAEATESMFDVFKNATLESGMAILSFAREAGTNLKEAFLKATEPLKDREMEIRQQIEVLEARGRDEDVEQIKKLRSELSAVQVKIANAVSASNDNLAGMSTHIGLLAGQAPEILMDMLQGLNSQGDLSKMSNKRLGILIKTAKDRGLSETAVRMLVDSARQTRLNTGNLIRVTESRMDDISKLNKETTKDLSESMKKIAMAEGGAQIEAMNDFSTLLMKNLNLNETEARMFSEIVQLNKDSIPLLEGVLKGNEKSLDKLGKMVLGQDMIERLSVNRFKKQEKTNEEIAESTEKTFKDIVDQTLSLNEMKEIAKDEIQYRLNSLGLFKSMSKGVGNIFKWLTRNDEGYMSESQKTAQEQVKLLAQNNSQMAKLLDLDGKGNVTLESQKELTKATVNKIDELKSKIKVREAVGGVLAAGIKPGEDPSAAFDKAIKDSTGEIKKVLQEQKEKYEEEMAKETKAINKQALMSDEKKKKLEQARYKILGNMLDENEDTLKENKEQKGIQDQMKMYLEEMNNKNALIAKYTEMSMKKDPEMMKELARDFQSKLGEGATSQDVIGLARSYGVGLDTIKSAYGAAGMKADLINQAIDKTTHKTWGGTPVNVAQQATLAEPIKVSSPGAVVLHPGEMILPKNYSGFNTIPAMSGPAGAKTDGGGKKEVTINVSAVEKDLAQRIANEVRKVMYDNQLTGMA